MLTHSKSQWITRTKNKVLIFIKLRYSDIGRVTSSEHLASSPAFRHLQYAVKKSSGSLHGNEVTEHLYYGSCECTTISPMLING